MDIEILKSYIAENSNKRGFVFINKSIYENCNNIDVIAVLVCIVDKFRHEYTKKCDYRINLISLENYNINNYIINKDVIKEFILYLITIDAIKVKFGGEIIIKDINRNSNFIGIDNLFDSNSILYYLEYLLDNSTEHNFKIIYDNITHSYSYISNYDGSFNERYIIKQKLGVLDRYEHRIYDVINGKRIVVDIWNNYKYEYNYRKRKRMEKDRDNKRKERMRNKRNCKGKSYISNI